MAPVEAVYVTQPYAHLLPLVRLAGRLGLRLVYAKPSETPWLIESLGGEYCGLTPLPLILRYGLEVHPGPMVWVSRCSPSLVVLTPGAVHPCGCRRLVVTSESVATLTYASLIGEACGFRVESARVDAESAVTLARSGSCVLLIGDEGVKAWTRVTDGRVGLYEFARLASEVLGVEGLAFAATAGRGCRRIARLLSRLTRIQPSLMDVLRASRLLRAPLPLASRYLGCTRLTFNREVLEASLGLLSTGLSAFQPRAAIPSSSSTACSQR